MMYHDLDLFYDYCNTLTEHNRRQTQYLSSIVNYFLSEIKTFSIISCVTSLIMISMLSLFECITHSSLLSSLEEIKLIIFFN